MLKVLIIDHIHPILQNKLEASGMQCVYMPQYTRASVIEQLRDKQGLIVRSHLQVDQEIIDAAPELRFIGRTGSGMEIIDRAYASKKNIACFNSPEGNCDSVAEHALGMILHLLHFFNQGKNTIKDGLWKRAELAPIELQHLTVGIIGLGHTGSALAKRLIPMGCKILAYDKYRSNYGTPHIQESSYSEIHRLANIVSIHLPLTQETRYLVDEAFIEQFHQPIWLINTSRGEIAKTSALVAYLQSGKIKGIGMDVFETEPITAAGEQEKMLVATLAAHDRVVMTPHTAGTSSDALYKMADYLAIKIIQWANDNLQVAP